MMDDLSNLLLSSRRAPEQVAPMAMSYLGRVLAAPATRGDMLRVTVHAIDGGMFELRCRWAPQQDAAGGILYPAAGDAVLVAVDERGTPWVPVWVPADLERTGTTGSAEPTGEAGGVLSGTYPDPGFAVDMATQAELDAVASAAADDVDTLEAASVLRTLIDAKGDLLVGTAEDTVARMAVGGSNDLALLVNSAVGAGVAWGARTGIHVAAHSTASATTDVAVTGVGFTPKIILAFGSINSSATIMSTGYGWGVSSSSRAAMSSASTATNGGRTRRNASALFELVLPAAASGTTILKSFDLVSMDADGFTFSRGTNDATTYAVYFVCIG